MKEEILQAAKKYCIDKQCAACGGKKECSNKTDEERLECIMPCEMFETYIAGAKKYEELLKTNM